MRFDIMTLFPELVERVLGESIIGRAQEAGFTTVKAHNIRDYSEDKHRRVDDTPYGGGKGMLMAAPPIYNCYRGVLADQLKEAQLLVKYCRDKLYKADAEIQKMLSGSDNGEKTGESVG